MIDLRQLRLCHILVPADPALLPLLIAPDAQRQTVILKPADLILRKRPAACTQKPEHTVKSKIFLRHSKDAPHIFHKGIQKDAPLIIHKNGNLKSGKCLLQIISIAVQICHNNADFPVAQSFLPDQPSDLSRCRFRFLSRVGRLKNRDSRLFFPILLKESKRATFPEPIIRPFPQINRLLLCRAALSGKPGQRRNGVLTHAEHLTGPRISVGILLLVHRHGNCHIHAELHKLCKQAVLHRRKTGKSVQYHHALFQQFRFRRDPAQHIQKLLLGNVPVPQICPKFLLDYFHILQLII